MTEYPLSSSGDDAWVAVVIPTRGRPALAAEAVQSALDAGAEVIVVDDADRALEDVAVLRGPGSDVSVVPGGGRGPANARNVGARVASAPWLVFLDDDDLIASGGLHSVRELLDHAALEVGLVFAGVVIRAERDGPGALRPPRDLGPLFHSVRGQLVASGFCVSRRVFDSIDGYDASLRFSENTELVLRAVEHCVRHRLAILATDEVLGSIWQRSPDQRTSNEPLVVKRSIEQILQRHADAFARDPTATATFHRIAGVNAARLRQSVDTRMHFAEAYHSGRNRMDLVRLWVSRTPALWRLVWRR